jgi:hypothetical protein
MGSALSSQCVALDHCCSSPGLLLMWRWRSCWVGGWSDLWVSGWVGGWVRWVGVCMCVCVWGMRCGNCRYAQSWGEWGVRSMAN